MESEVVGFNGQRLFLMPLEEVEGIIPGARIYTRTTPEGQSYNKQLPLGPALLGRVLDSSAKPLDSLSSPETGYRVPLITAPVNPLHHNIDHTSDRCCGAHDQRPTYHRPWPVHGGLFAGSGVDKSVLIGMMVRYTQVDAIVIGLIGECGREVKDFIENILGTEGRARSVVIAVPADVSPLLRMQGTAYATHIAENFRDRGLHVLLIMDSLTRYAMAQSEIALAIGESPLQPQRIYPLSVRQVAGVGRTCGKWCLRWRFDHRLLYCID